MLIYCLDLPTSKQASKQAWLLFGRYGFALDART
jgi:hypothetical protein